MSLPFFMAADPPVSVSKQHPRCYQVNSLPRPSGKLLVFFPSIRFFETNPFALNRSSKKIFQTPKMPAEIAG